MEQNSKERNIENAWDETKYLASNTYKKTTTTIAVISIISALIPPLFIASAIMVVIYFTFLYIKANKALLQHFAKTNGFKYEESAPIKTVSGHLFKLGRSQKITNVLSGQHLGYLIRIFNYQYTIGAGKNQQTYRFTVLEMIFKNIKFPHILLQSKRMLNYRYSGTLGMTKDTEIPLTNQFGDYFNLYSTDGYEIEVLEIFTPDLLFYLQENAKDFNIEFEDNKIYIFDDKLISNKKELNLLFDISKKILSSHGEIITRLHDDFSALHPYYSEK